MWPHFVNLLCRAGSDLISGQGTTWRGLLTPIVTSFLSVALTVFAILLVRGKEELVKHWQGNALIALGVTIAVNFMVYFSLYTWSCVRVVYADHQQNVEKIKHLEYFAAHENQFQQDLSAAQSKANRWLDALASPKEKLSQTE
jgi:type VI protein secretion system component VasK